MQRIVYILLILFGLFAIVYPSGLVNKMTESYDVPDLIRAWGIYAITIGLLLMFPRYTGLILILCFMVSILWHLLIVRRKGWTMHHKEAIVFNLIAICILFLFLERFILM